MHSKNISLSTIFRGMHLFNLGLRSKEQGAFFNFNKISMIQKRVDEPKEKSVVEVCIIRSKHILQMRRVAVVAQQLKAEALSCPVRFPSEDKLKDYRDEIKNRITEFEMSISQMLKPVLAPHGIILDNKYWFSSDDIRSGYVLLRKPNSLGATHVLFLRNHEDSFDGTKVTEGDVKLYKHVNHFLERLDIDLALKKAQKKSKSNE